MNRVTTQLMNLLGQSLLPLVLLAIAFAPLVQAQTQNVYELQRSFERPPDDAKIMMRWWWFGPAVTKPELEREMRLMKEGGIGGFQMQAAYSLSPGHPTAGIKKLPYPFAGFIVSLRFLSAQANGLGLRLEML